MKILKHILILLLLSGCIRELDYMVDAPPRQLIVNSIIQANRLIKVNVSTLVSIFDTSYHFVDEAIVVLNYDSIIDTLKSMGEGDYISHKTAKENEIYSITVKKMDIQLYMQLIPFQHLAIY